jgi:hypothetical protein
MDKTTQLRTVFEQLHDPYPRGVEMKCDQAFQTSNSLHWKPLLNETNASNALETYRHWVSDMLASCDLLRSRHDGRRIWYTALLNRLDTYSDVLGEENPDLMIDVPREAFVFVDRPYSSDTFLPNAFRHAIMIPDDLFPEAWKNRISSFANKN